MATATLAPTRNLSREHVEVLAQLDRFEQAIDGFHVGMIRETLRFFDERVVLHRRKEEEVLFPILAGHIGVEGGPIACMLHEHVEERRHLEAIRAALGREISPAVRDAVVGAGRAILVLLRNHIAKEDGILFPLSEELLTEDEKRRAKAKMDAIGYCCPDPE